jgi:hypothetical protein
MSFSTDQQKLYNPVTKSPFISKTNYLRTKSNRLLTVGPRSALDWKHIYELSVFWLLTYQSWPGEDNESSAGNAHCTHGKSAGPQEVPTAFSNALSTVLSHRWLLNFVSCAYYSSVSADSLTIQCVLHRCLSGVKWVELCKILREFF